MPVMIFGASASSTILIELSDCCLSSGSAGQHPDRTQSRRWRFAKGYVTPCIIPISLTYAVEAAAVQRIYHIKTIHQPQALGNRSGLGRSIGSFMEASDKLRRLRGSFRRHLIELQVYQSRDVCAIRVQSHSVQVAVAAPDGALTPLTFRNPVPTHLPIRCMRHSTHIEFSSCIEHALSPRSSVPTGAPLPLQ